MKNEKFCFSKGTGLIALVGVLLVGFVLFTQAANQPTSSSSRASGASCNPMAANLEIGTKCELKTSVEDTFPDGTKEKLAKTYTGRVCKEDVTTTPKSWKWDVDYANCAPTLKCNYGGVTYLRLAGGTSSIASKKDFTDNDYCTLTGGSGAVMGIKCAVTRDPSGNAVSVQSQSSSDCVLAKTPQCSFGTLKGAPVAMTSSSSPYYFKDEKGAAGTYKDANVKCIYDSKTNTRTGAMCYTDAAGNIDKSYSRWNADSKAACPVAAATCSGTCSGGTAIGSCATGAAKRCTCKTGMTYPTYETDTTCAPTTTCTGTCSGNVAIGTCAPNSTKKCVCKTGMTYPTYETNTTDCSVTAPTVSCKYGDQVITASSTPLKYVTSTVDSKKLCIANAAGALNGYRCKTDAAGAVNATGSVSDSTNCPVAAATCNDANYTSSFSCGSGYKFGDCKADGFGQFMKCSCDANKSVSYPTLHTVASC